MGSKNALIVAEDADLDVEAAFNGAYSGTGQKCTASSRLIVVESVHDAFVEKLTVRLASARVGHALEEGVQIGLVADARQLEFNLHGRHAPSGMARPLWGGGGQSVDQSGA